MTPEEVADYYGVPLGTIYRWRVTGYGPRAAKIGRHLRYDQAEVERFIRACQNHSIEVTAR